LFHAADREHRLAPGCLRRQAARELLLDEMVDMKRELFIEFAVQRGAAKQRTQPHRRA
jgi:hypothetical protein